MQAGGGNTTPPATGAVYQLVDGSGLVVHEWAAMPMLALSPALAALPNRDGSRAFLVPPTSVQAIGRGFWTVAMTLAGDAGPDLDRWSVGGAAVNESGTLEFSILQ